MAERIGMGEGHSGRLPIRGGLLGDGVPHMERKSGSHRHHDSAQSYRGTGHQLGNQSGNGHAAILPTWYHWTTVSIVVIGFVVLALMRVALGG